MAGSSTPPNKGPGKWFRTGLSLIDFFKKFSTERAAEAWFVKCRWPDGIKCPHCESSSISKRHNRQPQLYWCRECRKYFSVKTRTLMQGSKLPLKVWAGALYLMSTSLKGVSSMKLHRDLGVTQKSAWHLAQRIRQSWSDQAFAGMGPYEVGETYLGGKERNRHESRKLNAGRSRGQKGRCGLKSRETNKITAEVVLRTTRDAMQGFVRGRARKGAQLYSDDHGSYLNMDDYDHQTVKHSVSQYVSGMAHTNGLESFWAMLKRGYHGAYHHISPKHLQRYVNEFAGRHNMRLLDTMDQMRHVAKALEGKQLRYSDLTHGG